MSKQSRKLGVVVLVTGLCMNLFCPSIHGADYMQKPVKLVVCTAAGGGEDMEARGIAPYLEKHLGRRIIIDDQPGAGGKIAMEKFMKTEPDGNTLITFTLPKSVIYEYTDKVSFQTRGYTPVLAWSTSNQVLAVNANTWKTFDEFVKAAKTKTMAGGISGGHSQLGGLMAMDALGIKVNWVPYEGAAGSLAALAGNHLDFLITLSTSVVSLVDAGKLRPLILFSNERDPYVPNVPTSKELGVKVTPIPGIRGILLPPKAPPAIVSVFEKALSKAVAEPEFIEFAKRKKMLLHPLNSKEYGKAIAEVYPVVEQYKEVLNR